MNEDLDKTAQAEKEVSAEALAQISGGGRTFSDEEIARGTHHADGSFTTTTDDGWNVRVHKNSSDHPNHASQRGNSDGCTIIANHAIARGVFHRNQRTKTLILYRRKFKDRFVGEMIKRGYHIVGQKKIDSGQAANYYKEFSDFIAYGNGTKKGLAVGLRFYLRSVQLFIVGCVGFLLYNNE